MDSTILGVVLDSSIVIEAERRRLDVARFLKYIVSQIGEREAALCAITVAELAHGIHRADTPNDPDTSFSTSFYKQWTPSACAASRCGRSWVASG